jgi:hypothetical protein
MSFYKETYNLPLSYELRLLLAAIHESGAAGLTIVQLAKMLKPASFRSEKEQAAAFTVLRTQLSNARRALRTSNWALLASEGRGNRSGAGFRGVYRLVRR